MLNKSAFWILAIVLTLAGCSRDRGTQQTVLSATLKGSQSPMPQSDLSDTIEVPDTSIVMFEPPDSISMTWSASDRALLSKFEFYTASLWKEIHSIIPTTVTDVRFLRVKMNNHEKILDTKTDLLRSPKDFGIILLAGSKAPSIRKGLFSDSDYLPMIKSYYGIAFNIDSILRVHFRLSENRDTLEVPQRSIVVFQPSERQEEALGELYQDAVEYYSDFNEYTGRLKNMLDGKLPLFFSSARFIKLKGKSAEMFDTKKIFQREIGQDAGVLFINGTNKPILIPDVYDDYSDTIQKIYGIRIKD